MRVISKKWIFENLNSSSKANTNITATVRNIIEDIKKNKDVALLKYVKKFENKKANLNNITIPQKTLKKAYSSLSYETKKSLKLAYKRIFYYHSKQKKLSYSFKGTPKQLEKKIWKHYNENYEEYGKAEAVEVELI